MALLEGPGPEDDTPPELAELSNDEFDVVQIEAWAEDRKAHPDAPAYWSAAVGPHSYAHENPAAWAILESRDPARAAALRQALAA